VSDLKSLDHLGAVADEMLGGLNAGEDMRLRVLRAVKEEAAPKRRPAMRFAPAICCAALALVCVGAAGMKGRLNAAPQPEAQPIALARTMPGEDAAPAADAAGAIEIESIAAGEEAAADGVTMLADLGDGAKMRAGTSGGESLFESAGGDIALVAYGGRVYRMLKTPKDVGSSLLGGEIGAVCMATDEPSLASSDAMKSGLSNVAAEGAAIYSVRGLDEMTAVAAKVDGRTRIFQRVSYAGKGPGGQRLEDVFGVRGQVKEMTLSGVGTISGEAADRVIGVLLDQATLSSADPGSARQNLTVTLDSGLKLQLGVSGDTVRGCGGWSCPEFFEAFEDAL